jgi:hypothetical protein
MAETVETLILDLVEWIARRERTYEDVMDAWRTSCPRFPVWEEANERGLVEKHRAGDRTIISATPEAIALLDLRRAHRMSIGD